MESLNTDNWLVFESEDEKAAEYADFDEQFEMSPADRIEHFKLVKRVGAEYGFPLPKWTPAIPTRAKA